jgi:hypothetical protein
MLSMRRGRSFCYGAASIWIATDLSLGKGPLKISGLTRARLSKIILIRDNIFCRVMTVLAPSGPAGGDTESFSGSGFACKREN